MKAPFVFVAITASAVIASGAFPQPVLAHGGLSIERDKCVLRVGAYVIHFTGYQPQETDTQEFCEDIPKTGRTVVALDYVDPSLRNVPVEVKILRLADEGRSDEDQPVELSLAPTSYPTGTIHFEHDFLEPGRYVGIVTAREGGADYVGRFPFAVGKTWPPLLQIGWKILAVIAFGVGLSVMLTRSPRVSSARDRRTKA